MKKSIKKLTAGVLCAAMTVTLLPAVEAKADTSNRIVTLGADLSDDQREEVLEFFGLDEDDLDEMEVLTITNDMEHDLLDGTVESSVIGTRTYSCAYIETNDSDVINVKTANLTYVTSSAIYNALQTAGVEGCDVIVTAPFEVSGTGALTGIFEAYASEGDALDEDKEEVATQELIIASDLEEAYGEDSSAMLTDIKSQVAGSDETLSEDEIAEVIESTAKSYDISLSDSDVSTLTSLMTQIQDLDYDSDSFTQQAESIVSDIADSASEAAENAGGISGIIQKIINFFKQLFGMAEEAVESESADASSIFDSIDTSIFDYDE